MLHVKGTPANLVGNALLLGYEEEIIDWRWMLSAIRRRLSFIVKLMLLAAALAALYVVMRPVTYTAHTHLLLTNLKLTFSRDDALFAESLPDPSFLETQMQIMRSEKIALAVADRLRSSEGSEAPSPGLLQRLREEAAARIGALATATPEGGTETPLDAILRDAAEALRPVAAGEASDPDGARRTAMRELQANYNVDRIGMSNIVMIRAAALDPERAARIANEVARAYIDDQVAARIEAAQSASIWLRERLRDVGPKTRVIAQAAPPTDKSNPRGVLIIALAALAGCSLGVTYALLRQMFDRTLQCPEQLVRASGTQCLGIVPRLRGAGLLARWRERLRRRGTPLRPLSIADYAATHAASTFAQTLSHAKVAIDLGLAPRAPRCIGVTAAFAGEGTSTVALNLAHLLASRGERVLLIDGNGADPGLTRRLLRRPQDGLVECLAAGGLSAGAVQVDPADGMHFLPFGRTDAPRAAPVWTEAMRGLLAAAGRDYDTVICDLPPLARVAEARAAAQYVSGVVLVAGWRQVESEHLRLGLAQAGLIREKLLGAVLNRVDVAAFRRTGSPAAAFLWRASGRGQA
ncbi:hypothetical protein LNAOJCKE_1317 [Methylorubrum aminovorans]|uniref:Polysaccharide chain length determinant N-terminal domain-containing protein n=1 Tax=Methylorubrum aminovorans TaxID=269069 RepID=A0ABQ4UCD7_9HYPH|nr:Wzz/FepE/Etk N-terminal domain-containing protein [Methylorubrum aminovorans]GJE64117.1 hypothetical protein LNAOJCKE_1317 [Methylorubrum aminovorans]